MQQAALNAKANAEVLVKAYGRTVGSVVAIVQGGATVPVIRAEASALTARSAAAPGGAPTEVSSGQITISATATVMFIINSTPDL